MHKSKIICSGRMQYMGKWFGRWMQHADFMTHHRFLCEGGLFAMPMYHDMGKMGRITLHIWYYICCNWHLTIKPHSSLNKVSTRTGTCWSSSHCSSIEPWFLNSLVHTRLNVRWDIEAHVTTLINCAHFPLNMFQTLNIIVLYNGLPPITFDYLHIFNPTQPNPNTNFSHSHSVHSQLWHSFVKFSNIKSHKSVSKYFVKKLYFCSHE